MLPEDPARKPLLFGARLSNIPLVNLRNEHQEALASLKTPGFLKSLDSKGQGLVAMQFPTHEALTVMVQRTILGVEAYLPPAVMVATQRAGVLTVDLAREITNPRSGQGIANLYFNRLPGLLNQNVSLKVANKDLWKKVSRFYAEIRNPLFHGSLLYEEDGKCTLQILEMFSNVYEWIDGWCPMKWFFERDPSGGFQRTT